MYEFKYSKISEMTIEDAKRGINYIASSLKNKLRDDRESLSLFDQFKLTRAIDHVQNNFNVSINMNEVGEEQFDYSKIDRMIEYSKQLKKPLKVFITGSTKYGNEKESVKMSFSQQAINNMIELNNYLVDRNEDGLYFMEDSNFPESSWTFEEVITANSQVDGIVDYIQQQNFTPFEAATFIHLYITTQFSYKENKDNPFSPRSLIGVLTSDDIVCVGYASLTKAIIDKLNMPGLKCSTVISKIMLNSENDAVEGIDKNSPTGHMQNLVEIDDKKYDIKGRYITDACWDSKSDTFSTGKGIACFMYPVEDLLHLKGMQFDQYHSQVDEIFKTIGLLNKKIDPYALPIISENIAYSKPIDYDKYKESLTQVSLKMSQSENETVSEQDLENRVNAILDITQVASYLVFDEKAIGSIAKCANKNISESLKNTKSNELKDSSEPGME